MITVKALTQDIIKIGKIKDSFSMFLIEDHINDFVSDLISACQNATMPCSNQRDLDIFKAIGVVRDQMKK